MIWLYEQIEHPMGTSSDKIEIRGDYLPIELGDYFFQPGT